MRRLSGSCVRTAATTRTRRVQASRHRDRSSFRRLSCSTTDTRHRSFSWSSELRGSLQAMLRSHLPLMSRGRFATAHRDRQGWKPAPSTVSNQTDRWLARTRPARRRCLHRPSRLKNRRSFAATVRCCHRSRRRRVQQHTQQGVRLHGLNGCVHWPCLLDGSAQRLVPEIADERRQLRNVRGAHSSPIGATGGPEVEHYCADRKPDVSVVTPTSVDAGGRLRVASASGGCLGWPRRVPGVLRGARRVRHRAGERVGCRGSILRSVRSSRSQRPCRPCRKRRSLER